jgi:hypothetical protein
MTSIAQQLAHDVLALSEKDRMDIFVQLASSLPSEQAAIAESARRAEEMRTGKVIAMTEAEFRGKMDSLKQQLRNQA